LLTGVVTVGCDEGDGSTGFLHATKRRAMRITVMIRSIVRLTDFIPELWRLIKHPSILEFTKC